MTKVRISDDALRDLQDGYSFYEAQEPGLGDYFLSCLRNDIDILKVTAGSHRIVYRDYHRALPPKIWTQFCGSERSRQ